MTNKKSVYIYSKRIIVLYSYKHTYTHYIFCSPFILWVSIKKKTNRSILYIKKQRRRVNFFYQKWTTYSRFCYRKHSFYSLIDCVRVFVYVKNIRKLCITWTLKYSRLWRFSWQKKYIITSSPCKPNEIKWMLWRHFSLCLTRSIFIGIIY